MEHHFPRGIRNQNPGNIRQSSIKWQGMRENPFDHEFVEFITPAFGLRAMMKILQTYFYKYELNTVQSIVNRWAPPHENATDNYAAHVAKILMVKRYDIIDVPNLLIPLSQAITVHENGFPNRQSEMPKYWYSKEIYEEAFNLATKG